MAQEIEHKFLLNNNDWENNISLSTHFKQGYLVSDNKRSLRIRVSDNKAWINIKSATIGTHRMEYEYPIPLEDGLELLTTLCTQPIIEKKRYIVPYKQHTWEIDVFMGDNVGLVVAEIELSKIGEYFEIPNWIGREVTNDIRYYNNNLCENPYKNWKNKD